MPSHYYLAFTFIGVSFLSAVLSKKCNESQYPWPRNKPEFCCDRCLPGRRMAWRSDSTCKIQCDPCMKGQYRDTCNVELSCKFCRSCKESNLEFESTCNGTHDAVCRCKAGFRCRGQPCTECEQIPTTVTPSATTVSTTLPQPFTTTKLTPNTQDRAWLWVMVALLCAGIACFVAAKNNSLKRWFGNKLCYYLDEKPATSSTSSEDEEVSKPIQEVCGKCDQLLDV
ncbi:CD27 antigen [Notolabrus celidotus]|uniref:CD27 antigen n=1 Tax=Notolabrus celidotus TaxID=1203425 RepID=UPI00148FC972|nr:CD27 antigen [Notolabrus celidotus]